MGAVRAGAAIAPCGSGNAERIPAIPAAARRVQACGLVQLAAARADKHVFRVAGILGEQVAGEQWDALAAGPAVDLLDPQEVFYRHVLVAVERAIRAVEGVELGLQAVQQLCRGGPVGRQVKMLDLLADDPGGHRIYVAAEHVAPEAVGLDQRRPSPHEGVRDALVGEIVRAEEKVLNGSAAEFREGERAEQGARPAGKPFVNGDDRPVVLLNLLFAQRELRDERDAEILLDAHAGRRPSGRLGIIQFTAPALSPAPPGSGPA